MVQAQAWEPGALWFSKIRQNSIESLISVISLIQAKTGLHDHLVSFSGELFCLFRVPGLEGCVAANALDSKWDAGMLLLFFRYAVPLVTY